MIGKFLASLRRDSRGAGLVEFALIAPVLVTLLLGTLNLGVYYFAKNSVENALDEAARDAAVFPRPTDAELTTTFNNELLKTEKTGTVAFKIVHATTTGGIDYATLTANYSIPVDLVFVDLGSIPARAERRVYLPE